MYLCSICFLFIRLFHVGVFLVCLQFGRRPLSVFLNVLYGVGFMDGDALERTQTKFILVVCQSVLIFECNPDDLGQPIASARRKEVLGCPSRKDAFGGGRLSECVLQPSLARKACTKTPNFQFFEVMFLIFVCNRVPQTYFKMFVIQNLTMKTTILVTHGQHI